MTAADWRRVLEEAAELGVRNVQFIGGEPTLYPELPELVRHALFFGLGVEVYSNLARPLSEELWALFALPGVRLATSYYAADAHTHEEITLGPTGSHGRTRANIIEALRRSIPLRVGIVEVQEEQEVERARAELEALGVERINVDRLRQIGRGVRNLAPNVDQLCGGCADGTLAVLPTGDVLPCPMARWLILGDVRTVELATINEQARTTREMLLHEFDRRRANRTSEPGVKCSPDDADPCGGPLCDPVLKCGPDKEPCNPDKDKKS
jgi:hypothetical protein